MLGKAGNLHTIIAIISCSILSGWITSCSPTEKSMTKHSYSVSLEYSHDGQFRPPIQGFFVDASLSNPEDEAAWFVIPMDVKNEDLGARTVHSVQENSICLSGNCVSFLKVLGTESFFAFRLKGNTNLKVENLPLRYWGEEGLPEKLDLTGHVTEAISFDAGVVPFDPEQITAVGSGKYNFGDHTLVSETSSEELVETAVKFKTPVAIDLVIDLK